jgi:hypothetical protein
VGHDPRENGQRGSAAHTLKLILFATRPEMIEAAQRAGISAFIVDWEWRGKEGRQSGADTEINRDHPQDLHMLARLGAGERFCRINLYGPWTKNEVETALAAKATHVLLPMVRSSREVEAVLALVDGRCRFGILVETIEAVACRDALARLPVELVYVGLNDLAISRGLGNIFESLVDGTVEQIREAFPSVEFGLAGVTVVDGGSPIPSRLLIGEMARLDCHFTFLRRSFKRDTVDRDLGVEVARIQQLWRTLLGRRPTEIAADRAALLAVVRGVGGAAARMGGGA